MQLSEIKLLECWHDGIFYVEEWEEVPGLNCYYLASTFGRIYSVAREYNFQMRNGETQIRKSPGRLLNQMIVSSGYLRVQISIDGVKRKYYSHLLIAWTFLDHGQDRNLVNHKDLDKTNNKVFNLEWTTHRENSLHGHAGRTKTGVPGIYFHPTRNRYQGSILFNGKRYQIGDHKTIDQAKEAYSKKMVEFGLSNTRYAP